MSEQMPADNLDVVTPTAHPLAPEGYITTVALEQFGRQLREYRLSSDMTVKQLSGEIDWSVSKISRLEAGQTRPPVSDVWAYLITCGITDKDTIGSVSETARRNRKAPIDNTYAAVLTPTHRRFLEHEAAATELDVYDSTLVPDFLRTEAYAQSVESAFTGHASRQDEAQTVLYAQLRRNRAAYLLGPGGPGLRIIIDELVFYRPIGSEGRSPEHRYDEVSAIIRGLQHLNTYGRHTKPTEKELNPTVSIQVAPPAIDMLPRGGYPFSLASSQGRPMAVHTEWTGGGTSWFDDSDQPEEYRADFDSLSQRIPGAEHTNAILDDIQTTLATGQRIGAVSVARQYL
ncbi:MAG TPA: Scr1 family TA system antitoxin-like transcriptional regulator [Candidatus Saccharimonadales bacterium]|nr:Scr1 family TA system antitoxin-like transcriptional regulator [Candidatus Saccharimonadales bacterium]